MRGFSNLESLLLKLFGDVRPCSISGVTIHALVGGRTAQRAASCAPWTELDISGGVEGIESIGQCCAAAVPTGVQMGMRFAEDREQAEHGARIVIASHQCGAGDGATVLFNQREPAFFGELLAVVAPKVGAVDNPDRHRAAREFTARVTSSGNSWKTMSWLTYLSMMKSRKWTFFADEFNRKPRQTAVYRLPGRISEASTGDDSIDAVVLGLRRVENTVITACGFFLSVDGEVRNALEIADDASEIVDVVAVAVRALGEIALVDATTFVAKRVGDVEGEVVAAFHSRHAEEVGDYWGLREVLFEIASGGAAAGEVVDVSTTVEAELLDGIGIFILYDVEIRVVAVARYVVAVFAIPAGMLDPDVLGGNHFAVEEQIL